MDVLLDRADEVLEEEVLDVRVVHAAAVRPGSNLVSSSSDRVHHLRRYTHALVPVALFDIVDQLKDIRRWKLSVLLRHVDLRGCEW